MRAHDWRDKVFWCCGMSVGQKSVFCKQKLWDEETASTIPFPKTKITRCWMCEKQRNELRTLHTRKNKFKRDSFMFCPVNVLDKSQFAETDERCNCYANSPLIVSSTKKLKLIRGRSHHKWQKIIKKPKIAWTRYSRPLNDMLKITKRLKISSRHCSRACLSNDKVSFVLKSIWYTFALHKFSKCMMPRLWATPTN